LLRKYKLSSKLFFILPASSTKESVQIINTELLLISEVKVIQFSQSTADSHHIF
jgi:hypothetical protein